MSPILIASVVIGGTGIVCGAALAVAARVFAVYEDPRIGEATELLPGANCGGCGFAGCADYGKAMVVDNAAINLCSAASENVIECLGKLLGKEAAVAEKQVAIVLCGGDSEKAPRKFAYNGVADCSAAHAVGGGDKICSYGCLGYGSCARVCPSAAIELRNNIAVVHPDLCIGCSACVKACPRNIISMIPAKRTIHVLCRSKDKGPAVKKGCQVGCIGCRKCTKTAPEGAITMDGFLAIVDYSKEMDAEEIIEGCPTGCIARSG